LNSWRALRSDVGGKLESLHRDYVLKPAGSQVDTDDAVQKTSRALGDNSRCLLSLTRAGASDRDTSALAS
jgi:hypothetical protein